MKKLFVNVSQFKIQDANDGIHRVLKAIIKELILKPQSDIKTYPVFFDKTDNIFKYANLKLQSEDQISEKAIICKSGDIFLQVEIPLKIERNEIKQLSKLKKNGVKIISIVHDLIPINLKHIYEEYHSVFIKDFENYLKKILILSDKIIGNSKNTIVDVEKLIKDTHSFKCNPNLKYGWFHLGSDFKKIKKLNNPIKHNKRIQFLQVGSTDPRKCHLQVLTAFDILWNENFEIDLTFVGHINDTYKNNIFEQIRNHKEFGKKVKWKNNVTDSV